MIKRVTFECESCHDSDHESQTAFKECFSCGDEVCCNCYIGEWEQDIVFCDACSDDYHSFVDIHSQAKRLLSARKQILEHPSFQQYTEIQDKIIELRPNSQFAKEAVNHLI